MELSPKGEGEGLCAGIEKPDLECVIGDRPALPDQLVQALPGHDALAVGIDIGAMAVARWHAVNRDAEPYGLAVCCGAENEVEIPGMEPVDDAALLAIEDRALLADRPIAG
jgi:hypothetical protein